MFVKVLSPKIKPAIAGITHRCPNQNNFPQIIKTNFDKLDTDTKESYILGDFDINNYKSNKYLVREDNRTSLKFLSSNIKNDHQFYTMHGLNQLIKSPTCVTCSTSTSNLIDHMIKSNLTSFPTRVSQKGVIDVRISDHQLISCTHKISSLKTSSTYKYLNLCSFKNYSANFYKEVLKQLKFRNCQTFDDINDGLFQFFKENDDRY